MMGSNVNAGYATACLNCYDGFFWETGRKRGNGGPIELKCPTCGQTKGYSWDEFAKATYEGGVTQSSSDTYRVDVRGTITTILDPPSRIPPQLKGWRHKNVKFITKRRQKPPGAKAKPTRRL